MVESLLRLDGGLDQPVNDCIVGFSNEWHQGDYQKSFIGLCTAWRAAVFGQPLNGQKERSQT